MGSCSQKCLKIAIHQAVWRNSTNECTKDRECQVWRGWSTAWRRALRQHGGLNQSKYPLKATNFTAQIPRFFPVFNFRSGDYYSYCTCVWSVTNRWGLQWIKGDVFSELTGWQWNRISSICVAEWFDHGSSLLPSLSSSCVSKQLLRVLLESSIESHLKSQSKGKKKIRRTKEAARFSCPNVISLDGS